MSDPSIHYFLGANTAEGFFSVYDDLVRPEEGTMVWYIKGGPGNGKSTFMRRIGAAAEEKGLFVEYAHCSGDPDSLDGVVVPELALAYVDATSPHVQEPAVPGGGGRYLDLCRFYRDGLANEKDRIAALFRQYRAEYGRAYDLMRFAALCSPEQIPGLLSGDVINAVRRRAREFAETHLFAENDRSERGRFLSAYTCRGWVSFPETAASIGTVYALDDFLGLAGVFLEELRMRAGEKGCRLLFCPDPLVPSRLEGLLFPSLRLAILCRKRERPAGISSENAVRLRDLADGPHLKPFHTAFRKSAMLKAGLLDQAQSHLAAAKAIHDDLEAVYHPYVDFEGVDRLCEEHLSYLK